MIPQHKQAAVQKAVQSAFGTNEFESIQPLTKGLSSALIFKMVVRGNPYLLRVITRTDAMADPSFYFACMEIGAKATIAPYIHYLSVEDRISITGFIEEQPFTIPEARTKLAYLFRQVHALPKFPFRINYFEVMDGFVEKCKASRILPEHATKDVFDLYTRIANVYPRNDRGDWVSCHNDAKPENIVFDGLRPWLVDWEGAFLNDRYLDLAVVANFVVQCDADETEFLQTYFEERIDDYKQARFFLMQQLLHVFYFTFLSLVASEGKPVDLAAIAKQDFRTFHDRIWDGTVTLKTNESRLQYAWLHKEQLLHNMHLKRMDASLQIISAYAAAH